MVTSGPISIALSRSRWRRRDRRLEPGSIPVGWSASIVQTIWRAGAAGSAPGLEGPPVRLAFLPVSDAGFGAQVFPFDGGAAGGAGRARTGQSFAIPMEVGRASGRGRVCQYGEVPVVAGTLRKKQMQRTEGRG